jgi:hypothetical protein
MIKRHLHFLLYFLGFPFPESTVTKNLRQRLTLLQLVAIFIYQSYNWQKLNSILKLNPREEKGLKIVFLEAVLLIW